MADPTDAQILWWVQHGDYRAFELLLDRYYGAIERYAECLLRDPVAARRAAAAAFEEGFREARRPRGCRSEYPAHLFAICRRKAFSIGKRRDLPSRARPLLPPLADATSADQDELPLSIILDQNRDAMVRHAFEALSANDREIIHLAFEPLLQRRDLLAILRQPCDRIVTAQLLRALHRLGAAVLRSPVDADQQPGNRYAQRSAPI